MNDQSQSQHEQKPLGIAGWLAKAFITSPISLLLIVAFLAIGILGLQITPRQEDPQVSVPMVDILVSYPGATTKEVESQVTRPLEAIMYEITGVEHVYSASSRGRALVTIQFTVGEDYNSSIVKLHDKIEANKNRMPSGIQGFAVKPKGVDDVPSVTLTLWSNEVDDASLRLVALDVLQSVREVKNTSQSFIVDGRADQLVIEILPERLATYGVSLDQVANAVRMANSEREAGQVEPSGHIVTIVTGSFLQSADDVSRLMVAVVGGMPVYVRDVATVKEGASEASRMVGFYTGPASKFQEKAIGSPAVTIAIAKKQGSNGVEVSEAVLAKIETLKGRIIPDNIFVATTRDYGASAKEKVNHLLLKLVIATGIVTILVWLFLGWRASSVVLVVIPIVLTTTVFAAWLLGLTIDRVSLFALIFSIGILVDDAIVVVENIYRRWLLADSLDTGTAVDAVREVGNPTIVATFTVIAALLPMGFVSGMMGPYMSPIPVLGSVAMLISLFAAFAFTPWLTNQLKPNIEHLRTAAEKEHKQAAMMDRFFRRIIIPMIREPRKGRIFLYGIFVVFFMSLVFFYTKDVRVKMLPLDNKPEFNIVVNFPEGTALPVTANLINELSTQMQEVKEVTDIQTYSGTASPYNFNGLVRHYYLRDKAWQGDIQVQLVDKGDRERSSHEIADAARKLLTPIATKAGARIQVVEMPPGPPVLQTIVAEIYGPSAQVRRQFAEDLTKKFEQAKNISDVDNFLEEPHEILRFKVDADKAQRNGISVEDVNRALEMAMGGYILGDIKKNALIEPTPIVMQVPLGVRSDIYRLVQLPVTSRSGVAIPLAELGSFSPELQEPPIYHKDLRPVEFVTGEGVGLYAAPVYAQFEIEDLLMADNDGHGYRAPDGTVVSSGHWFGTPSDSNETSFEWGGEWTVTFETFRDMGIAFIAALILIYMLIVAQFGNFILPAIVMAPIPLTLIGIVPGHWIMNAEFSATSMIGFIALAGIIVRNSILLVDFAREAVMEHGMSVIDAVIHSCEARTRPIAITALALIGGSSVIVSDPIFQGMGVSLIFGGLVSTILTLLVIPLGCISAGKALCTDDDGSGGSCGGAMKDDPAIQTMLDSSTDKNSASSYSDDESLVEKIKDAGSTAVGLVLTISGMIFMGIKSLIGGGFNLLKGKNSDSVVVRDINESHNVEETVVAKTVPKAKPAGKATPKAKAEPKAKPAAKATPKAKAVPKAKSAAKATPKAKAVPKAKPAAKATPKAKATSKAKPAAKATPKAKATSKAKPATKAKPKAKTEPNIRSESEESTDKVSTKKPSGTRRGIRLKDDL